MNEKKIWITAITVLFLSAVIVPLGSARNLGCCCTLDGEATGPDAPGDEPYVRSWCPQGHYFANTTIEDGSITHLIRSDSCYRNVCEGNNDFDGDGVDNDVDNCPDVPNVNQEDNNNDGVGDECENTPAPDNPDLFTGTCEAGDPDSDGDNIPNACDKCPYNEDETNSPDCHGTQETENPQCSGNTLTSVDINPPAQESGELDAPIELTWEVQGDCDPVGVDYKVLKSLTGNDGSFNPVNTVDVTTATDANVEADTTYYYKIAAMTGTNVIYSSAKSVRTRSSLCAGPGSFCKDGEIVTCTPSGALDGSPTQCGDGEVCVDDGPGTAVCVDNTVCEECNRLYGMYSSQEDLRVDMTIGGQESSFTCGSLKTEPFNVCFEDSSTTIVDQFKSCSDTCFQYKSERACETDTCGINCTWTPAYGQENNDTLGIGVCGSADGNPAICSSCQNLQGGCNSQKCSALGACFYNGNECLPEAEMTCNDYKTQDMCVGSSPVRPVKVNATWSATQLSGGNHEVLNRSNDYLGLGMCYWSDTTQGCYKNADNFSSSSLPDDCDFDDVKCTTDFEPPNTTVLLHEDTIYSKGDVLPYNVYDNNYESSEVTTYHCFGDGCRPGQNDIGDFGIYQEDVNNYILRFYSKDPAKNLEVIKEVEVPVDSKYPEVSIDHNISTSGSGANIKTNLGVNFTVEEDNSYECDWDLTDQDGIVKASSVVNESSNYTFFDLRNGRYDFTIDCTDEAGNSRNLPFKEHIHLSTSTVITEFSPEGTVNESNRNLYVETQNESECRYDDESNDDYSSMTPFENTGDYIHHNSTNLADGDYTFYVACNITQDDGRNIVVEGDDANSISFTVDTSPPVINPVRTSNQGAVVQEAHYSLECDDDQSQIVDGNEFGCKEIYYCKGNGCTPQPTESTNSHDILVNTTNLDHYRYYAEDEGGNTGQIINLSQDLGDSLTIDVTKPDIAINDWSVTSEVTESGSSSNLEVSYEVSGEDHARCTWDLDGPSESFSGTLEVEGLTEGNIEGNGLAPGSYELEVTCEDEAENEETVSDAYTINTDNNIHGFSPESGTTLAKSEDITISADTEHPGTCYYSPDGNDDIEEMSEMSGEGSTTHSATVNVDNNGTFAYYVACNLTINEQEVIVSGHGGHVITFAVDTAPPVTEIVPTPEDDMVLYNATFELRCEDRPTEEDGSTEGWASGCRDIRYCKGDECEDGWEIAGADVQEINFTEPGDYLFKVSSIDNGGVEEDSREVTLLIDQAAPSFSGIGVEAPPAFQDEDLTISSSDSGNITGIVSDDNIQEVCALNDNSGESNCIGVCGNSPCISSSGEFKVGFSLTEESEPSNILVNATDAAGNTNQTTLKVLLDNAPPAEPEFSIE